MSSARPPRSSGFLLRFIPATASERARLFGLLVALGGVLDLASALTPELRPRFGVVREAFAPSVVHVAAGAAALIGLALLALGRGIAHRRRTAYYVTLVMLVLAAIAHVVKGLDVEEATASVLLAGLLVWQRALFCVRLERARVKTVARGAAVVVAAYVVYGAAGLALRRVSIDHLTVGNGARELVARFVGLSGPLGFHGVFGHWFPSSLTVLSVGSLVVLIGLVLAPMAEELVLPASREWVARLVDRADGDTLDPFALRSGKRFQFSADGRAAVAYRLVNGVGLASGDPVGESGSHAAAWALFRERCDQRGWRPAVLAARQDRLAMYEAQGFRSFYIGDEAIIDVTEFSTCGRAMRAVRQAVSRTGNFGCRTEIHREGELDPTLRRALRGISDAWRAGAPERGYSMALGELFAGTRPECVIVVTRDRDGAPIAFQRYVPCRAGAGLSLDVMRRDPHAPNGVNERMIVDIVDWAGRHGVSVVSLNFAAFRELLIDEETKRPFDAAQAWIVRRLNPYFQLDSLLSFNAKFRPRWVRRYLVYRSPSDLLPVAVAALNAEALLPFDRSRGDAEQSAALPALVAPGSFATPGSSGRRSLP